MMPIKTESRRRNCWHVRDSSFNVYGVICWAGGPCLNFDFIDPSCHILASLLVGFVVKVGHGEHLCDLKTYYDHHLHLLKRSDLTKPMH